MLKEERGVDESIMGPAPSTFESVITTAKDAKTEINGRKRLGGGKPRDYYNKFCQHAHQHRSVFSIFPDTDKYASVFCGSIKTLIKANNTSRHRRRLLWLTCYLGIGQLYSNLGRLVEST